MTLTIIFYIITDKPIFIVLSKLGKQVLLYLDIQARNYISISRELICYQMMIWKV